MGFSGFLVYYVLPHIFEYIIIVFLSVAVSFLLYRFIVCSIYEYIFLFTPIMGLLFSLADCIFLYKKNLILMNHYSNFLITTSIYYLTVVFLHVTTNIKRIYKKKAEKMASEFDTRSYTYAICLFILWIILSLLKIKFLGIRSFAKVGGGTGLITRLLWIVSPLLNFTIMYIYAYGSNRRKKLFYIYLCLYIFFAFFSNSRSAVIGIFIQVFVFIFLNPNCIFIKMFIRKYGMFFIGIGILFAIALIVIMNSGSFVEGLFTLLYRFIAFGDVYPFAYGNQVIDKIGARIDVSFFKYICSSILPMFRLINYEYFADSNIPGMLVEEVAGKGIPEGPNSRFNITGYLFWGYEGSIIFSVFCAVVFSIVHFVFILSTNKSYKRQLFGSFVFSSLIAVEQDAALIPQFLGSIPLVCIVIFVIEILINGCKFSMDFRKQT
jgi:hypothetical protein